MRDAESGDRGKIGAAVFGAFLMGACGAAVSPEKPPERDVFDKWLGEREPQWKSAFVARSMIKRRASAISDLTTHTVLEAPGSNPALANNCDPMVADSLAAAEALLASGNPKPALDLLEVLTSDFQVIPDVIAMRARLYLASGKPGFAALILEGPCLRKSCRQDLLVLKEQALDAASMWHAVLAFSGHNQASLPQDADHYLRLARALCRTGQTEQARVRVEAAIRLKPGLKLVATEDWALDEVWGTGN